MNKPEFPAPVKIRGRLYWARGRIEDYKRRCLGLPPLNDDGPAATELVSAKQLSKEIGVGRRTIGRRVFETETAAA
jgi:hypothetical protein